jgi:hypothetical protein
VSSTTRTEVEKNGDEEVRVGEGEMGGGEMVGGDQICNKRRETCTG